jgi:hypothetical protein
MEGRSGPGRIADIVQKQSHADALVTARLALAGGAQYTACMSQRDPIRVFVTHCFEESEDYVRAFEYLESARNF